MDPYKTRKMAKVIAIVIAVAMIITSFSFVLFIPGMFGMEGSVVYAASTEDVNHTEQTEFLEKYIQYIQENYKDKVDYKTLIDGAFTGVSEALGDPYSVYYADVSQENSFYESVSGEYSGIGVSIENYEGKCRVVTPMAGTPAEKAGIKSGDIITSVDNVSLKDKSIDQAAAALKGQEGTKVTVTLERSGQTLTFVMVREKIKNVSVTYKMLDKNNGYIQITSFDNDTNIEFNMAKIALINKGADSLIIDIRNNPGGLVSTATDIANQIMDKGPITHFEQQGKTVDTYYADGSGNIQLPIVLLVNQGSASSSEILAGALQDSKKAKLVGTKTYGKGVAQQLVSFLNGGSMKLSMYYFLTPNKTKIDHIGIIPDFTIENPEKGTEEATLAKYAAFAPMSEKVKAKAGAIGLNVFGAQQRLDMLGYEVNINGKMDDKTVAAIVKFQKESKLFGSGILDYTTMNAIDKSATQFALGIAETEDLQLKKAMEILN